MGASRRIAVFGAGYVGLVSGACFAELGHSVVIRDVVAERIEALRSGDVPIYEAGLAELLAANRERLSFTLDAREAVDAAEFVYVAVGTPPTYSGDADLSAVWTVIDELPRDGTRAVVVMKSTVPVGTGEKVRIALDARGLGHVGYVSNPEFLAEGSAVRDFMNPDRIVIGAWEEEDGDAVEALHEGLDAPIVRCDVASAEMVKLASNAFLTTRISFINEIANVCELVGADVEQVARGVGLDHRLGPHFLRAGVGYGGSCLVGEEAVFVADEEGARRTTLQRLFAGVAGRYPRAEGVLRPAGVRVLAWLPGSPAAELLPVAAVTRRRYRGLVCDVRVGARNRLRCTDDHPFVVADADGKLAVKPAAELTADDLIPVVPIWAATPQLRPTADPVVAVGGIPHARVPRESPEQRLEVAAELPVAWERVTKLVRRPFVGPVYSLEVPNAETFVTTAGVIVHNCFPKDVSALKQLASNSGYHFQLLSAVIEVNELQKRRVVAKLEKHLGKLRGKRIALLGLAFKPNTDDMREAPSMVLASRLLAEGAEVTAWDPVAHPGELLKGAEFRDSVLDAVRDADAAVIVTEWAELRDLPSPETRAAMRGNLIVDGRNMLDPEAVRTAGFVYEGIGRPSSPLAGLPETEERAYT
jgi:UDP-glucose 6-dehydrogenase